MNAHTKISATLGTVGTAMALSLGAMGTAQAAALTDIDTLAPMTQAQSTKSRADVRAELQAAKLAGLLPSNALESYKTPSTPSTLSRQQVRQETAAWRMTPEGHQMPIGY